eukprot:5559708-Amphidinium_carterae.1
MALVCAEAASNRCAASYCVCFNQVELIVPWNPQSHTNIGLERLFTKGIEDPVKFASLSLVHADAASTFTNLTFYRTFRIWGGRFPFGKTPEVTTTYKSSMLN